MNAIDKTFASIPNTGNPTQLSQWLATQPNILVFFDQNGASYLKDNSDGAILVKADVITSTGAARGAGTSGASSTTKALQEAVNIATTDDVIQVAGDVTLTGQTVTVNKRLMLDFMGHQLTNGQIKVNFVSGGYLQNIILVSPVSPGILRQDTYYHVARNVYIPGSLSGIGFSDTSSTRWMGLNVLENYFCKQIETTGVGLQITGSGFANNLNHYKAIFLNGNGGVGVGVKMTNSAGIFNDMNIFNGLQTESLGTGIQYYQGRNMLLQGYWAETNATYDIDIGTDGYYPKIMGYFSPAPLVINNPNNRAIYYYDKLAQGMDGFIGPLLPNKETTVASNHMYISTDGSNDMVFNVATTAQDYRLWWNGAAVAQFEIFTNASGDITLRPSNGTSRNLILLRPTMPATVPANPIAGAFYFDGQFLQVYSGGAWVKAGLKPVGFAASTPAFPASATDVQNTNAYSVRIYMLTAGTVTAYQITDPLGATQAVTASLIGGEIFELEPNAKIQFTYSIAPTWKWYGE